MYTKEEMSAIDHTWWNIIDPDGTVICNVDSEEQADGLLSHLELQAFRDFERETGLVEWYEVKHAMGQVFFWS